MQDVKDTFYRVLRGRLAAANPLRTVSVRGVTRPGLLIEENELPLAPVLPECFRLVWTETSLETQGALPLVTLACEVRYETAGTTPGGGMDRGRALAAMDTELLQAMTAVPQRAAKMSYAALASGGSAVGDGTGIWWSGPVFGPVESRGERLGRKAKVAVLSYQST